MILSPYNKRYVASTHAPVRGRTLVKDSAELALDASTHAPREGATPEDETSEVNAKASTHAPREGANMKLNCQPPGQWNYNSRPFSGRTNSI